MQASLSEYAGSLKSRTKKIIESITFKDVVYVTCGAAVVTSCLLMVRELQAVKKVVNKQAERFEALEQKVGKLNGQLMGQHQILRILDLAVHAGSYPQEFECVFNEIHLYAPYVPDISSRRR